MIEIEINVTEKHIEEGMKYRCTKCPVALAIMEHPDVNLAEDQYITVWPENVHIKRKILCNDGLSILDEIVRNIQLPFSATSFIRAFDNGSKVKPFSFKINI
jgi:hypothetical protein